ncbi:MAG: OmpA family protein [Gammaproteobacteria bacterium]|nr:OmpA family protein [Gammaproteobacteria bacterium]
MSTELTHRLTIIATGALAIVVFGGLCIRHNIPAIEADLKDRATTELRQARMGWAEVEVSGRDLLLSGVAPDTAAQQAAVRVASVRGSRIVDSELTTVVDYVRPAANEQEAPATLATPAARPVVSTASKFRTNLILADDRVVLDGAVPGERQRLELVELAQAKFGIAAVEARLNQTTNPPDNWLQAAAVGLDIVDHLVFGEIAMVDRSLHVTGLTASEESAQKIEQLLANELPQGYSSTTTIGTRSELDDVLRNAPELAQRLAKRNNRVVQPDYEAPSVLSSRDCERQFRETIGNRRILFDVASATLTADSLTLLDSLADVLKQCAGTRMTIEGHTDDQGLVENNLALSQRRAESVMQYLVAQGISLGRLSARGYGEGLPIIANDSADNRAINRRIEFIFENE